MLVSLFCMYNRQHIILKLFPFDLELELPLFVLFIITLILGILIGRLMNIFTMIGLKFKLKKAQSLEVKDNNIPTSNHA